MFYIIESIYNYLIILIFYIQRRTNHTESLVFIIDIRTDQSIVRDQSNGLKSP